MIQQSPVTEHSPAGHPPSGTLPPQRSAIHRKDHAVVVLDDDSAVLTGLENLLGSHGYKVRVHARAEEFLRVGPPEVPSCLILGQSSANGITGLQIHTELQSRGCNLRTVFLATEWNARSVVAAMRAGADNFLTKPYNPDELLDSVAEALQRARTMQQAKFLTDELQARATTLTQREREIVRLVVAGRFNKEIADELGLALVTVKVHRGRAMKKLRAGNPAELAHFARLAGL